MPFVSRERLFSPIGESIVGKPSVRNVPPIRGDEDGRPLSREFKDVMLSHPAVSVKDGSAVLISFVRQYIEAFKILGRQIQLFDQAFELISGRVNSDELSRTLACPRLAIHQREYVIVQRKFKAGLIPLEDGDD